MNWTYKDLHKCARLTGPKVKLHTYSELPSLTVYPWVSRFSRWPPGLTVGLENLTDSHKNTISENIVCSFERKSVRVCKVGNKKAKKRKSPQFVVQIKVADINLFRKKFFRKWSGTIRKLWTKGANNVQVFNHLNLAALHILTDINSYLCVNIWYSVYSVYCLTKSFYIFLLKLLFT